MYFIDVFVCEKENEIYAVLLRTFFFLWYLARRAKQHRWIFIWEFPDEEFHCENNYPETIPFM